MKKVWEGEISCSCKEKHLLCCCKEEKPTGNYFMKYKCVKAPKDITDTVHVTLSSKLIANAVSWHEVKSPSILAIECEIITKS